MWILIISLLVLALFALLLGILRNRKLRRKVAEGELDELPACRYGMLRTA